MLATVNPNLKVCGVPNPPPSLLEGLPELEVGVFPHPTMLPSSIEMCIRDRCGSISTESMKNDVAVAQRLGITATTLDGILTVKRQGRR